MVIDHAYSVEINADISSEFEKILTPEAISFVAKLTRQFREQRDELLHQRQQRQIRLNKGEKPDFLAETKSIREAEWQVAPIPNDLQDRRVEITGPTERKMVINALNSGASVFMTDFEDSNSPTWENMLQGQVNLYDAVRGSITYQKATGKHYSLNDETATLMVRPRGWHLDESRMLVDEKAVPASIFDFALYFFHNAHELLKRDTAPYFYLPKLENHLEARLWNDIFVMAQDELAIAQGTIKATVLIETILASYEMDEILWELREHSAGLNCGRWDYIFSVIKKFHRHPEFVMPDRSLITMNSDFMRAYSLLVIKTCHRRGVHAIGGMAAQIPIKNDEHANQMAFEKVRADKEREAKDGHDGTWVAHPGLVVFVKDIFDQHMPQANQIATRPRKDIEVSASDLICVPIDMITEQGLRHNLRVGIQYTATWLQGNGCVPLYNLMEDAATAEISRSQVWQWLHHQAILTDGRMLTTALYDDILKEELDFLRQDLGTEIVEQEAYQQAVILFDEMIRNEEFEDFLTLPAYQFLN